VHPVSISRQNARSVARRSDGFPGDFIGDLPVAAFIQPAGLPITTSRIEVLRRPVESVLAATVHAFIAGSTYYPGFQLSSRVP
jgi:hypothetical protein